MKKTLIAAAVMAASGVAFAASNVTLYGVMDGGVVVSKAKKEDTKVPQCPPEKEAAIMEALKYFRMS